VNGEARSVNTAYQIAILNDITEIREHKTKELTGTEFTPIPHDGRG
jgi:hypothetical protein